MNLARFLAAVILLGACSEGGPDPAEGVDAGIRRMADNIDSVEDCVALQARAKTETNRANRAYIINAVNQHCFD